MRTDLNASDPGIVEPGQNPTPPGGGQPNQPDRDPGQVPPGSGGGPEVGDPDQVGQQDPDKGLNR